MPAWRSRGSSSRAVDDGDGLGGALGLGEQAGQGVGVVLPGQGDDDVVVADLGVDEHVGVGEVALQHGDTVEGLGQLAGPVGVPLD